MTEQTDLIVWLRAQLDDDERTAKAATSGPWRHNPDKHWRKPGTAWFEEAVFAGPAGADAVCIAGTGDSDDPQSMADAEHIARHDPARVLAEVDAKRRILDEIVDQVEELTAWAEAGPTGVSRSLMRLLALPYADRPGYRDEWRP